MGEDEESCRKEEGSGSLKARRERPQGTFCIIQCIQAQGTISSKECSNEERKPKKKKRTRVLHVIYIGFPMLLGGVPTTSSPRET